jgi:predicted ATPase
MDHSEVTRIRDQFQAGHWPLFLERIDIAGLRGWRGQSVLFKFPVVAVVGENGSGKSTVLKVAASAYDPKDNAYYPSAFFLETHWDKIQGVDLGYQLKHGEDTPNFRIKKPSERWSFPDKRFKRKVFWFDVARTLPLDGTAGYAKVARLAAGELATEELTAEYRDKLSYVLGREYKNARFARPDVNEKRIVGLLKRDFGEISQFHQGAGEDTTLDLFQALQQVPQYSLVIIDEVEASLHPRAQRRLMKFLLEFSRTKRTQVIVSTHSPYILEELPPEARVLLVPTPDGPNILYGASPEFSLSKLDDVVHPEAFIFVEDRTAEVWLREIIVRHPEASSILNRVRISSVGPANVVQMMGQLAASKRLPYKALGVVDGDTAESPGCTRLPGANAPEKVLFSELKEKNWGKLHERFGIGAGDLHTHLGDAILDPDFHRWPSLVGDRILKSSVSVWEIMAAEWCRECLKTDDRDRICDRILQVLAGA